MNCLPAGPACAQSGGWLWECTHRGQGQGWYCPHVPWYLTLHPRAGCREAGFWFPSQICLFCVSGALACILFHLPETPAVALTSQTHLHQAPLRRGESQRGQKSSPRGSAGLDAEHPEQSTSQAPKRSCFLGKAGCERDDSGQALAANPNACRARPHSHPAEMFPGAAPPAPGAGAREAAARSCTSPTTPVS